MLYKERLDRDFNNRDANDKIQEAYMNIIMEGTEEAKAIRELIKKKFKLTSRDISVKSRSGSTSSAVTVSAKTAKALPYLKKIKELAGGFSKYDVDQATGSILAGGNTFIFTSVDYQFESKLTKKIESELNKQMTDDFLNDIGTNVVKVYGYDVVKERGTKGFSVPDPKTRSVGQINMSTSQASNRILNLMIDSEDSKNLKKLG